MRRRYVPGGKTDSDRRRSALTVGRRRSRTTAVTLHSKTDSIRTTRRKDVPLGTPEGEPSATF
ncbi:hypothetical protein EA462_06485 [Natrarchaeobius halalkaliphilus]|uniref:Uncharacterized protein n=1 Tax=Natrarchaeobius halalkaliphilus TaxID=1679091 RepID=A0A3N6LV96_9EURY|nr:hypothetical protein EA462_06485 [Natrarchaeobius halalkaliphilus]